MTIATNGLLFREVTHLHSLLSWMGGQTPGTNVVQEETVATVQGLVTSTTPREALMEFLDTPPPLQVLQVTRHFERDVNDLRGLDRDDPALTINVEPPAEVTSLLNREAAITHSPNIVFLRKTTDIFPIGTVLINVLLPSIENQTIAERVFRAYQGTILAIFEKLKAAPFACLTGLKLPGANTKHDLYTRGFRFFLGPDPQASYPEIVRGLTLRSEFTTLRTRLKGIPVDQRTTEDRAESTRLAEAVTRLMQEHIAHKYITTNAHDTTLVKLF